MLKPRYLREHAVPIILVLLFVVQLVLVLSLFPPEALTRPDPINYNDYMLHYYHTQTFASYMQSAGQPWGYNPYWMAGYPDNTIYDVENKTTEVLTYAASVVGLDDVLAFKWYVFLLYLLGPFLTYWAARNFGFSRASSLVILALQIVMWYTIPFVRVMVVTGTFIYNFASYLSMFILSVLYLYLQNHGRKLLLALALLCPLAVFLHLYSAVIIGVPGLLLLALYRRGQTIRTYLALGVVAVLVLLVNLFWLLPMFRFLPYSTVSGDTLTQGSLPVFIFWSLLAVLMTPGLLLVIIFAVPGFRLLRQELGRQLTIFFLGTLLFFLLVGALGRYTPVTRMLVALRYHINIFEYLAFPAALALIAFASDLRARFQRRKFSTALITSGMGLAVLIPLLLVMGLSEAPADRNPLAWFYSRTLDNAIADNPQSVALLDWLRRNTNTDGRILIESEWSPMAEEENAWYYMHYEPILPFLVGREFIGGPRPDSLLVHHFTSFHLDFVEFEQLMSETQIPMLLFNKPIDTISLEQLQAYFDLYNVKWVIAARPIAKDYFARYPDYTPRVATLGDVWVYEVNRKPSYLINGTGQTEARPNRIGVRAWSGGDAILKYHWMEGLRTNPELVLERVTLMDDPVGFIKVRDAPASFEVYNGY